MAGSDRESLSAVQGLAAGRHEVLGPLGQDSAGVPAFLGRDLRTGRLVVLKQTRSGAGRESLHVIERLDDSVPPPAGSCPFCQTPFSNWDPTCPQCQNDLSGSPGPIETGNSPQAMLEAVRKAAPGFEVLGMMPRAIGGAPVYFARESGGTDLVALRLEQETPGGARSGLSVVATRMMRPKLQYGTVGGDSSRPPWGAVPSPPFPMRTAPVTTPGPSSLTDPAAEKICPQCGSVFGPEHRFCPVDGSALRGRSSPRDLVGRVIAERYHILSKLGEGGMGMVYLAEHVRMGRRCAVKVMNPILSHDPDSVSRFNREAANASRINHPNVAAIYDFGETADELVYLAMEFVEGEALSAILQRERALPEGRAIKLARQTADALAAAHDLGIVHRDLKPDNIMITQSRGEETVKVVDFGIAKATRGGKQTVTRTGYVVGTPAYMSPEQILGDTLDGRSDLYSLGCIVYEMITGERAFAGSSGEVSIGRRLNEPPPRPRQVKRHLSKSLDRTVTKSLARSPEERFQTATEFRDALREALAEIQTKPSWRERLPWGRHRPSISTDQQPGIDAEPAAPPAASRPAAFGSVAAPPPPPSASRRPMQSPGTAPVPVGWEEAVQPLPQQPRMGTVIRPRAERHRRVNPLWIVGGSAAVLVLGLGAWWMIQPTAKPAPPPILPEPIPPSPAAGTTAGSQTNPPAPAPTPPVPAALGSVRFAQPLPAGARVSVDGKDTDVTKGELSLPPGTHMIVLRASGFRTDSEATTVAPGETSTLLLRLEPATRSTPAPTPQPAPAPQPAPPATTGTIALRGSIPPEAEIQIDGRRLLPSVRLVPIAPGTHWIMFSVPGYRPDSASVEVTTGERTDWVLPELTPLAVAKPEPPVTYGPEPTPTPAPKTKPETTRVAPRPTRPAPPPAQTGPPAAADYTPEIRQVLADYLKAVNQRDLDRLKKLYPSMSAEQERRWRDVFRHDVTDLRATMSVSSLDATSESPQSSFEMVLAFKPKGDKLQTFLVAGHATFRRDPTGWHFANLIESGK